MTPKAQRAAQFVAHFLGENKTWLLSWAVIALVIVLAVIFWPQGPSPVPDTIKVQANFAIIYPKGYSIDPSSWKYLSDSKAVQFTAKRDNYTVVFTEQQTPLEYQDDAAAYNRFIGSLRPSANFTVPLGTVSLANFVTAVNYEVVGETGILNTHNTLLLAHPDTELTDSQWRSLFESLKID